MAKYVREFSEAEQEMIEAYNAHAASTAPQLFGTVAPVSIERWAEAAIEVALLAVTQWNAKGRPSHTAVTLTADTLMMHPVIQQAMRKDPDVKA